MAEMSAFAAVLHKYGVKVHRSELEWLNAYNERVYQTLRSLLPSEVADWLRVKTLPVGV